MGAGGTASIFLGTGVGAIGGEEAHAQTVAEMAAHVHQLQDGNGNVITNFANTNGSGFAQAQSSAIGQYSGVRTTTAGNGSAANIMQPSAVVNVLIKF